jgi:hypothetical protein
MKAAEIPGILRQLLRFFFPSSFRFQKNENSLQHENTKPKFKQTRKL